MIFCIQNIDSLDLSDPIDKRSKTHHTSVPSYIDTHLYDSNVDKGEVPIIGSRLEYRNFGMFTAELKKREAKFEEKMLKHETTVKEDTGLPSKKTRGRKTKARIIEELNAKGASFVITGHRPSKVNSNQIILDHAV